MPGAEKRLVHQPRLTEFFLPCKSHVLHIQAPSMHLQQSMLVLQNISCNQPVPAQRHVARRPYTDGCMNLFPSYRHISWQECCKNKYRVDVDARDTQDTRKRGSEGCDWVFVYMALASQSRRLITTCMVMSALLQVQDICTNTNR